MVETVSPARGMNLRPYSPADAPAVLVLVEADRIPGQPRTTPAMLSEALEGRSLVDAGWWAELNKPVTQVAVNRAGAVVGVVSYAPRARDYTGQLLCLHCREDETTADALLHHALTALPARRVEAFQFASALSLGLEALPVGHRPATVRALEQAGFTGKRLWRYMRADLPAPTLPRLPHVHIGHDPSDSSRRRLEVRQDGSTVAEAVIGSPVQGVGVLWWIEVAADTRKRGLGRAMLGSVLDALTGLGAKEAILYVDDDAPPGHERDRTAANRLYESAGFAEIDRLHSYTVSGTGLRGGGRSGCAGPLQPGTHLHQSRSLANEDGLVLHRDRRPSVRSTTSCRPVLSDSELVLLQLLLVSLGLGGQALLRASHHPLGGFDFDPDLGGRRLGPFMQSVPGQVGPREPVAQPGQARPVVARVIAIALCCRAIGLDAQRAVYCILHQRVDLFLALGDGLLQALEPLVGVA
ncbi:hypothetical protein BGM19_36950 [Streptomyces agglomeratus]|uniref:GNAT family N-acetyltransferase n=1 Tax=Streptomyces agglomeratus TaxID=285458 RepID=UPI00086BD0F6|nr:GNAT family N-acetyltransferase [Streptomyces agglomeratus]OEJ56321.1 hypothetical protein BGM19_36950 [Streptomyces agglomeratus]